VAVPPLPATPAAARYAALFNARDWEGVRAMLVDDVKLDLVSREKRAGRQNVSHYFSTLTSATGAWPRAGSASVRFWRCSATLLMHAPAISSS
jgi:hypothetical protein